VNRGAFGWSGGALLEAILRVGFFGGSRRLACIIEWLEPDVIEALGWTSGLHSLARSGHGVNVIRAARHLARLVRRQQRYTHEQWKRRLSAEHGERT
jgi:hypothetical protein